VGPAVGSGPESSRVPKKVSIHFGNLGYWPAEVQKAISRAVVTNRD